MISNWTLLTTYFKTKYRKPLQTREQLLQWQDEQVQQFLKRILPQSPFYKEYYQEYAVQAWRTWPMIDKSIMMANFSTLNTVGLDKDEAFRVALSAEQCRDFTPLIGDITVGLSSGTSGNRGIFLVSAKERQSWAGTVLAKLLPRTILGKHRIAFFLRANSQLYHAVSGARIQFEFYDLLQPLEEHRRRLNELKPTLLVAPPSVLRWLSEQQSRGRLRIAPEKIISVAEVLDPLDEQRIAETFKQKVHQVYQCTEGFLASTCSYGTIHLNEDIVAIQEESLDDTTNYFMPIITDFSRTTQPIIRYKLNDILVKREKPCLCGLPHLAIERIEGRSDDILYFPHRNNGAKVPIFPDYITRALISASEAIEEYQVIQHDMDQLEIKLRTSVDHMDSMAIIEGLVRNQLQQLCDRTNSRLPNLSFSILDWVPGAVKLRRVHRGFEKDTTLLQS